MPILIILIGRSWSGLVFSTHLMFYHVLYLVIVPSLLKRWKRLESGFDASGCAFKELTRHYKDNVRKWAKEEQKAQVNRHLSPEAMDIYDTVKEKGVDRNPA